VHSNSMSRKLQVTIEPSDTHYIKLPTNQIKSLYDNFLQDSCLLTLLHLAALYTF
jgi:hypothetical protein